MRRSGSRTHSCAYDVEITWQGAETLYVEHVASGQPFQLRGQPASEDVACFVVPPAWLDGDERTLVTVSEAHVHAHLDDCIVALSHGESAELAIGPLHVRITHSAPMPRPDAAPISLAQHRWTLASFAVHGFALACMAMMPPTAQSMSLDLATEDARYLRYLSTTAAVDANPLPWPDKTESANANSAPADRREPDMIYATDPAPSRGPSHPVNPYPVPSASTPETVANAGILGVLKKLSEGVAAPDIFGGTVDYDAQEKLSQLYGSIDGDPAFPGPGRPGGKGVSGTIDVGNLPTLGGRNGNAPYGDGPGNALSSALRRPREHTPRAIMGEARVQGSLSKEVIRREIHRHLNEVRFCYETALARAPELAGRISVTFLIAPSGVVQGASIAESNVSAVELCLVQAVRRWTFPAPEGGGYVQVSYPFLFAADAP